MIGVVGIHPYLLWGGFLALVFLLLWLDLFVFHRKAHAVSIKEALAWAGVWFAVSLLFNVWVYFQFGADAGLSFFTGYLLEKALSVDNLFVMVLLFSAFGIASKHQHRILFWGILGVLVLRGILILVGTALVERFAWLFLLFGLLLLWSGLKMFFEKEEREFDHERSIIVRFVRKAFPVSRDKEASTFFVKEHGRRAVTILFITLVAIECTDLLFALDSIPAIFAITTDPFIIFTSNVFAILGLRSLYFVVAKAHEVFAYLRYGIALILVMIGVKLILKQWWEVPVVASLIVIFIILAASIAISLYIDRMRRTTRGTLRKR